MLEKPVSVSSEDLDAIMGAVEAAGVQMFDGTMWMHNPRTARMRDIIRAPEFGQVVEVTSSFSFRADDAFFNSDVRMQPGGDPLGCLGDLGWYCIRAALFAFDFELPEYAAAHPGGTFNVHGVPSYLAFTLIWPRAAGARHPRRATITTGFDIPLTFTLDVKGTQQTLSVRDLVLPRSETESVFSSTRAHGLSDFQTPDITVTEEHVVPTPKSQEACMWEAFAGCVRAVRNEGRQPDRHWHAVARATQQVVLAVAASARQGCAPVAVANLSPARL
ncbi:hypothetical protein FOA52_008042 [Chlamydomonas sp. UWO 241]|nr:hypothetical protein FOA52_008042 [Chlamydomonas sp. UWO 241]